MNQCCWVTKTGRECRGGGLGDPPLCHRHEQYRASIELDDDAYSRIVEAVLDNPKVSKGIDKLGGLFDKVSTIISGITKPGAAQPQPQPKPQPVNPEVAARAALHFGPAEKLSKTIIKERHRALCESLHPDKKGGSTAATQQINTARDILLKLYNT
jgi:hypothetical protein